MEFKSNQSVEIKHGKFIIKDVMPTSQGSYNLRLYNLKDGKPWVMGKSMLEIYIKSFEKEELTKQKEKEEKRKARRKQKFLRNLEEGKVIEPYIGENAVEDQKIKFYKSLGYFANNAEIIAEIADKVKGWFDECYYSIKGSYPEGKGYYPFDPKTNKWASEIRIKFNLPDNITSQDIVFGPEVNPISSSVYDYEINKNELGWHLLSLGFNLGKDHNIKEIKSHIPHMYVKYFDEGF